MTAVEAATCIMEEVACSKMTLRDRLRALQESATKWERRCSTNTIDMPERLNFEERQKVFGRVSNPLSRPFHASTLESSETRIGVIPSSTLIPTVDTSEEVTAQHTTTQTSRGDQSTSAAKVREINSSSANGVQLEFVKKKPRVQSIKHHDELKHPPLKPQDANSSEPKVQSPSKIQKRKQSEEVDEKMEADCSYLLTNPKRAIPKPARRMPTRYQNIAQTTNLPNNLDPSSSLRLDTEDKENQQCLARSPQSEPQAKRPNISSAVPFQLPVIGKEHCGVRLRHVERKAPFPDPMLIRSRMAGKYVDVRLVQPTASSVHERASYLLVTAKKMIVYNGAKATVNERAKISQLAHEIIAGKEMFGYSDKPLHANEDPSAEAGFYHILGAEGIEERNQQANLDEEFEEQQRGSFRFHRISVNNNPEPIECDSISSSLLSSDDVVVADFGSEIYMWFGRNSNRSLGKAATAFVEQLKLTEMPTEMSETVGTLVQSQRPSWILCRRLAEGIADSLFRHKFPAESPAKKTQFALKSTNFQSTNNRVNVSIPLRRVTNLQSSIQPKDEDETARKLARQLAECEPEDDFLELEGVELRPHDSTVFTEHLGFMVLNGDELVRLEEQPVEFNAQKCYVIEWQYRVERPGVGRLKDTPAKQQQHDTGREREVFFYWLGSKSTIIERSRCALALRNMDKKRLKHIRMEQGNEYPFFISLFKDGFIVSDSGVSSYLIRSYGGNGDVLAAMETPMTYGKNRTAWMKIDGNELQVNQGTHCPSTIWTNAQLLAEQFASAKQLTLKCNAQSEDQSTAPTSALRFYRIFGLDGEEMFAKRNRVHFTFPAEQKDLTDCVLIENGDCLWIWSERAIGKFALKTSFEFWFKQRGKTDGAIVVSADNEPDEFKSLFPEWTNPKEEDVRSGIKPTILTDLFTEQTSATETQLDCKGNDK
ncbi:hypothetical protein M3Y94_00542500 [Aphelenchoides besseyi]|nr:hypothetical protein M3Y94_00542500 [Aphelenchoides besseyi]KAI6225722.1 HP domain-containing protein [Aphelenchoides besseyi]